MRCNSCHNDNPPGVSICEWCGADLNQPKARTRAESTPGGSGAAVSGPGEKRRTMYEPSPAPSARASRPPADDFFGNPPPSRPPLRDPEDPFAQSVRPVEPAPSRQPAPEPAPQPAAPPPRADFRPPPQSKNRTIIENPIAPAGSKRRIRGALFCFKGADDPGSILPVHEGRNSLGRNDDRDVTLADGRVSGEHGFLFIRKDRHTYVDTSSNGSRVDGQIVYGEQIEVRSGSVLEMGSLRIILVIIPPDIVSQ